MDAHYQQHLAYNNVLAKRNPPIVLPIYPILTIEGGKQGLRFWLDSHESWHESVRGFANVEGINLADVDFSDQGQFYEWLDLHAQEHAILDLSLGVA